MAVTVRDKSSAPEAASFSVKVTVAVTKKGLEMACGGGNVLLVEEVQAQGGKRMRCADYLRGHPITIEE